MTNRVTDQETQNALIDKFRLDGVMPELEVSPTIVPVVQVAALSDALNIGAFEKWRSVFGGSRPLVDPNDISQSPTPAGAGVTNCPATSHMVSGPGNVGGTGRTGVKLPGAGVGVFATDGIYRGTVKCGAFTGVHGGVYIDLYDQAVFGGAAALGPLRKNLAASVIEGEYQWEVLFDSFFIVRLTDQVNSLQVSYPVTGAVAGTGMIQIGVTKLIDEIPPNVIFP